jgi:hypothetical protein
MLRAFEEDEAHAVGVRIEPPRIEQFEIDAAQPRMIDGDQRAALRVRIFDDVGARRARARRKPGRVGTDPARDEDGAGDFVVDALDVTSRARGSAALLV